MGLCGVRMDDRLSSRFLRFSESDDDVDGVDKGSNVDDDDDDDDIMGEEATVVLLFV